MADELYARLYLLSTTKTAEEAEEVLGVKPEQRWRMGDPVAFKPDGEPLARKHTSNGCALIATADAWDVEEQLNSLFNRLPKDLLAVKERLQGWQIEVSVSAYFESTGPAFHLSPATLARIALLGAALDVDLYAHSKKLDPSQLN